MNAQKEILRQKLKKVRLYMTQEEVASKSMLITQKLIDFVDWPKIKIIHIYTPVLGWNEVNTKEIINWLADNWPHVEIVSPSPNKNQAVPEGQFDLIVVPTLGFDKAFYRLGNGGGWYDRFLTGQTTAQTIGLAYSFAEVEKLPHESHDILLQQIITETSSLN